MAISIRRNISGHRRHERAQVRLITLDPALVAILQQSAKQRMRTATVQLDDLSCCNRISLRLKLASEPLEERAKLVTVSFWDR